MKYPAIIVCLIAGFFCLGANGMAESKVHIQKATLAAGCFWGVEKLFWEVDGVVSTQVGYTGGKLVNPDYHLVCTGATGHAEAIQIEFDPSKISYAKILEIFFKSHDATQLNRQGNDIGTQYRSAVFYHDDAQKNLAQKTIEAIDKAKVYSRPVVTQVAAYDHFYPAEEYHQKYLKKNPYGYCGLPAPSEKVSKALKDAGVI